MRWYLLMFLLVLAVSGCGSPKVTEILGDGATLLVQTKYEGGLAMLGRLPSGEWSVAVVPAKGTVVKETVSPVPNRPFPVLMAGAAVVTGQAPDGAVQVELMTENRQVIKGKVENGAYLIVWPTAERNPVFLLRILDAKGEELFRWPPPGGLPAA